MNYIELILFWRTSRLFVCSFVCLFFLFFFPKWVESISVSCKLNMILSSTHLADVIISARITMKTTTWESSESPSASHRDKWSPSYASTSTVLTVSRLPPSPLISTPPVLTTPASANHSPCSPGRKASNEYTDHSSRRTRLKTQWQGIWLTIKICLKIFQRRFIIFVIFALIFVLLALLVIFFAFYIILVFRILKSFHVCGFPVNEDTVIQSRCNNGNSIEFLRTPHPVSCRRLLFLLLQAAEGRLPNALLILQHIFSVCIKKKTRRERLHAGHALDSKSVDILSCQLVTISMHRQSGLAPRPVCCCD